MDFSAIEARVNASVFARMANAHAFFGGGPTDSFPIVFDKAGGLINDLGIVTHAPSFTMQPAAHAVAEGQALTIDSVGYMVRSVTALDEGGWQRVALTRS